jgi:hypothetical protein
MPLVHRAKNPVERHHGAPSTADIERQRDVSLSRLRLHDLDRRLQQPAKVGRDTMDGQRMKINNRTSCPVDAIVAVVAP